MELREAFAREDLSTGEVEEVSLLIQLSERNPSCVERW